MKRSITTDSEDDDDNDDHTTPQDCNNNTNTHTHIHTQHTYFNLVIGGTYLLVIRIERGALWCGNACNSSIECDLFGNNLLTCFSGSRPCLLAYLSARIRWVCAVRTRFCSVSTSYRSHCFCWIKSCNVLGNSCEDGDDVDWFLLKLSKDPHVLLARTKTSEWHTHNTRNIDDTHTHTRTHTHTHTQRRHTNHGKQNKSVWLHWNATRHTPHATRHTTYNTHNTPKKDDTRPPPPPTPPSPPPPSPHQTTLTSYDLFAMFSQHHFSSWTRLLFLLHDPVYWLLMFHLLSYHFLCFVVFSLIAWTSSLFLLVPCSPNGTLDPLGPIHVWPTSNFLLSKLRRPFFLDL